VAAEASAERAGWIASPAFDLALIAGVLALALAAGGVALARPSALPMVLALDFWLLAGPHVGATWSRIALDGATVRERWFLLFVLPPLVLALNVAVGWVGGAVALSTLYYLWQSWHYTKQSYGIARAYQRAAGRAQRDWLADGVIFAFPIWGLCHRASQQPTTFYEAPIWLPAVPVGVASAAAIVALGLLAGWLLRGARGEGQTLFVLSHVVITGVSYVVVRDVTQGWLFLNVWHNAQYLFFVWAHGRRRFAGRIDAREPRLSWLMQPRNVLWWVAFCVGSSATVYWVLGRAVDGASWGVLPVALIAYQTFNFHHYLVDAVIWRRTQSRKG